MSELEVNPEIISFNPSVYWEVDDEAQKGKGTSLGSPPKKQTRICPYVLWLPMVWNKCDAKRRNSSEKWSCSQLKGPTWWRSVSICPEKCVKSSESPWQRNFWLTSLQFGVLSLEFMNGLQESCAPLEVCMYARVHRFFWAGSSQECTRFSNRYMIT